MPKVSEAHRESRRDQILDAAVACFLRRGVRATTMADIIAESDLSAGAIYGYFEGKQELALAAMRRESAGRRAELDATAHGKAIAPSQVIRIITGAIMSRASTPALVVQMWGEAASDPEFEKIASTAFAELGSMYGEHLLRWLEEDQGLPREAAVEQAELLLPVLLALVQGFVLQSALVPGFDQESYLAGVDRLLHVAETDSRVANT